jgi:lauroyl/myristoyl acyltransferase
MRVDSPVIESVARLPLWARRRALRLAWRYQQLAKRPVGFGYNRYFRDVLRLSHAEAQRLDRESIYHDDLLSLEWLAMLLRSTEQVSQDASCVDIVDPNLLAQLSQSQKSVVLAPVHTGFFALAFARLMRDYFPGRRMLILRASDDSEIETRVIKRICEIGVDIRFLNIAHKNNYIDAARYGREGAVIVFFIDLPGTFGGAYDTELFGAPAQLALGVVSFARMIEATVAPLAIHSSLDGDTLSLGQPFECVDVGEREKARVCAILRRHIERSVLAAPDQWIMWSRFSEYAPPGAAA